MRWFHRISIYVVASFAFSSGSAPPSEACAQTDVLETVLAAWKGREQAVQGARFAWTEIRTVAPHSQLTRPQKGAAYLGPDSTMTIRREVRVLIQGNRMRYMRQGAMWDREVGDFVNRTYMSAFDGVVATQWYDDSDRATSEVLSHRLGFLSAAPAGPDADLAALYPVLHLFRGTHPDFGNVDVLRCRVVGSARLDGTDCWIIQTPPIREVIRRYFVDAARDFTILRIEGTVAQTHQALYTFDVAVKYDATARLWIPTSWNGVSVDPNTGRVQEEIAAEVDSCEINPTISSDDFQVSFPPGTVVTDRSPGGPTMTLVLPDGSHRPLSGRELADRTYDEIMAVKPGYGLSVWILSSALFVAAVATLYYWRSQQRLT